MIVKSFRASSAVRALKKVREEMGQEAIVLKTRQIRLKTGGTAVEITACIEKPTVGVASRVLAANRAGGMKTAEAVAVATEQVKVPPTKNRIREFVPERVVTDREEASRLLGHDPMDDVDDRAAAVDSRATRQNEEPAAGRPVGDASGRVADKQESPPATQKTRTVDRAGIVKQAAAKLAAAMKPRPQAAEQAGTTNETAAPEKPAEPKPVPAEPIAGSPEAAVTDAAATPEETAVVQPAESDGTASTAISRPLGANDVDHQTIASAISAKLMETITERIAGLETRLERMQETGVPTTAKPRNPRREAIDDVCNRLMAADVPEVFVRSFAKELSAATEDEEDSDVMAQAHRLLTARLAQMMVPHFDFVAGDRLVFVGPAGAGKSSVMGKLAFRLAIKEKMKVNLATLDTQKMAAHEEIASYADVLGVPLEEVPSASNGNGTRKRRSGWLDVDSENDQEVSDDDSSEKEPVRFIDTPALPSDEAAFEALCARVASVRPTNCFAVFSALTRSADILRMAERLRKLSPSHTIVTMLDVTSCRGTVIAAAQALSTKVAFVCNAPAGKGQLLTPDPDRIARLLLNTGVDLG